MIIAKIVSNGIRRNVVSVKNKETFLYYLTENDQQGTMTDRTNVFFISCPPTDEIITLEVKSRVAALIIEYLTEEQKEKAMSDFAMKYYSQLSEPYFYMQEQNKIILK